ncbi:Acetyl-coenzyme A carboxyl transferase alpha chain [Thermobrachium celere DSM 8682]|uniref:Acetyl-coenzyme A carboxylase carboxyl transferase subunit alpha n=1 Tax=Thermobrachium celere DSM 8682 TaxID=941824 RepID=R7RTT6_9CLOT|nr:Acetyl-coenzyme A carboxyl transferase alpha chain [Thermobrachium celere DSM 8682]
MSILELDRKIEELESKIEELRIISTQNNIDLTSEIEKMEKKLLELRNDLSNKLTPWDRVMLARLNERPTSLDYIEMIFDDFIEFHGDRLYGDDPAIVGGIATLNGIPVTVIGEQKGRNTKENLYRNFGMPHPEGYRKALRLMKQAEKFKRPIITFVDTPGAYCGIGAEERGQAEAIARNLMEMSTIDTLKIAIVIGEGSSGGALAISVADEIWMLENAVYSILSPEGFASILWKDASRAKEAADVMKMTAYDLKELGIITRIIKEPAGGAHKAPQVVAEEIKRNLLEVLQK